MWKEKQTKEIINKETVKKDLLKEQKVTLPLGLTAGGLCIFCALLMSSEQGFLAPLLAAAIGVAIVAYDLYILFRIVKFRFDIVEDHLLRKVEDERVRRAGRTRYIDVFYFNKTGRYHVTGADGSAWSYSEEGDKFYVVVMGKRPKEPMKVYSSKVYEYKGD